VRHQVNATRALGQRDVFIVYPLALFGGCEISRNEELLDTLINNKWPPKVDPGGHGFSD
jgi:hypothetical protein